MSKVELRKSMREKRKNMDSNLKRNLDEIIRNVFFETKEYPKAKIIFIYVSIGEEFNTIEIIKRILADGKRVCVPKVFSKTKMEAIEIKSLDDLNECGSYGILEPSVDGTILSEEVDLSIVPGLAFDKDGKRLGYGGGYYDRFFEKYPNSFKISLCYAYQLVTDVYHMPYDISIDMIISEKEISYI